MKILRKILALLTIVIGISLTSACGSSGDDGAQKDTYATSAAEIYALGQVLGAKDAVDGIHSDYARHLDSFDSEFVAQFRLGYDKGYSMYE